METVVGCSVGTGWAVLVSVAAEGPDFGRPAVVDRRRVDLVPGPDRFAYHLAAEQPPAEASRLVAGVHAQAAAAACAAIAGLPVSTLAGAVVVGATPGALLPVAECVRTHTTIHTAEGALYRSVLGDAFAERGVAVSAVARNELPEEVALAVGRDAATIQALVADLGKSLGPPWRREQKEATLAGWWGLTT
ncbi:MAG TPA: hypothetical protein VGO78_07995 [Acidimicrobiales bacterium]|nr:hypothetical protein [Acidimicrobiales bacterium]